MLTSWKGNSLIICFNISLFCFTQTLELLIRNDIINHLNGCWLLNTICINNCNLLFTCFLCSWGRPTITKLSSIRQLITISYQCLSFWCLITNTQNHWLKRHRMCLIVRFNGRLITEFTLHCLGIRRISLFPTAEIITSFSYHSRSWNSDFGIWFHIVTTLHIRTSKITILFSIKSNELIVRANITIDS